MTVRPGSVLDTINQGYSLTMRINHERDALESALRTLLAAFDLIGLDALSPETRAAIELRINLARSVLKARKWPDWRAAAPDTAIKHDRTVPYAEQGPYLTAPKGEL